MPNQDIELRWIIAVIRRRWWLIILMVLLATVTAYIVTQNIPPVYEASTTLLISPAQNSTASLLNELMASERLALTYSQMMKERPVLDIVRSQLDLEQSTEELVKNVQAQPVRDTQLIQLTVSDSDPDRAALIANTIAEIFKARVELLSAERYAATIDNAQTRVDRLETQVGEVEVEVGGLRTQKVEKDIALRSKQTTLDTLWKDYQALQNNQQQIELTIADATGKVYIFEPVLVKTNIYERTSTASAVLSVGQIQALSTASTTGKNIALTYGNLIITTPMLEKIIQDLNLTETPDQLTRKITLEPVDGIQLIRLSVEDADASKVELIGTALVNAFIKQAKDLLTEPYTDQLASIQTKLSDSSQSMDAAQGEIDKLTAEIAQLELETGRQETILAENRTDLREAQKNLEALLVTAAQSSDTVTISQPAQAPVDPRQNQMLYIVMAGVVGFAVGAGLAFLLEATDDRIRTEQDVRKVFDLPMLGTISRFDEEAGDLVIASQPASAPADDFRVLSLHIRRLYEQQALHTILVTSPIPMEGKSVIVSNLALALAKIGLSVIAVDADMRLPRLHTIFKLDQKHGLANSLSNGYIDGCLQNTQLPGLKVLTSGGTPPNPAELLVSANLEKLLQELAGKANIVLIDCPPVLTAADASILAPITDGVLLVLKAGQTESQSVQNAVEALRQAKANVIGAVLNAVPDRRDRYYRYYHKAEERW
jgi:polysaccharide biosynthesis transport protein